MMVRRRLTRWGNGYGIRITKAEATRLRIEAGDDVEAEVFEKPTRSRVDRLAIFRFGGAYDIDEVLDRALTEEVEETGGDH